MVEVGEKEERNLRAQKLGIEEVVNARVLSPTSIHAHSRGARREHRR